MKIETEIPIESISKMANTRDENVDIQDLMDSIEAVGLLQPIIVSEKRNGGYTLIAGHRRFLACKNLGKQTIPAVVNTFKNPTIIQITENTQRTNLSKEAESKAVYNLMKKLECKITALSRHLGKPYKWVEGRVSFHAVREFLIDSETLPIMSINTLTFDISRAIYKHPQKLWLKMAAEALGKRWYPDELKEQMNAIADPEYIKRKKQPNSTHNSKGNDFKERLLNELEGEGFGDFSIQTDDPQCIMKLMFVEELAYKKVLEVLQNAGGEII